MIVGVGVDIIEIARFNHPENPRFTERVFTHREQAYIGGRGPQSKAGLFAAKEAVAKALGTGFHGFWPNEIEILHDAPGCPFVLLHDQAARVAKRKRICRISVSISHNQTTAVAMAAAERDDRHARADRRTNARRRSGSYS